MIRRLFHRQSLKTRVTVATLAAFAIGIWILTLYTSRMLRDDMVVLLGEKQFATTSYIADGINREIEARLGGLGAVAGGAAQAVRAGPGAMQALLDRSEYLLQLFNGGVLVVSQDGTVIADLPRSSGRLGVNLKDNEAVAAVLDRGRAIVSRPAIGRVTGRPVFGMTQPVHDAGGKVIGAVAGLTDLGKANFLDAITATSYGKSGTYLVADLQSRRHVTGSDRERVARPLPTPGVNKLLDRFMQGHEGYGISASSRGVEELLAAKGIPAAGWVMGIAVPSDEAFAPIRAMQQRMFVAAIFLTLLAGSLIWWMLGRQLAPVFSTIEKLASLPDREPPRSLPIDRDDEIGALVGGFNGLLEILRSREQALRESESRSHDFAAASGDWFWESDAEGRLSWISDSYGEHTGEDSSRELGRTMEEVNARLGYDFHPRETIDTMRLRVAFRDHRYTRLVRGSPRWRTRSGVPRFDASGAFLGYRGATADITAQVEAEQRAHSADARLREAIDELDQRILLCDAEDRIVYGNRALLANPVVAAAYRAGMTYADFLAAIAASGGDPGAIGREQEWRAERLAVRRESDSAGYELERADGACLLVNYKRLASGGRITVATDITERKRAEAALRESEARYRAVVNEAPIGIAIVVEGGNLHEVNDRYCRMLGYAREELQGRSIESVTHPEDWPANAALAAELEAGAIEEFTLEKRYLRKDGAIVWANLKAVAVRGPGGTPLYRVATMEDTTERHRTLAALQASESRFRDFAAASADWYWETDAEGRTTWISDTYYERTGVEPSQVLGLAIEEIGSRFGNASHLRETREAMRLRVPFRDLRYPREVRGAQHWRKHSGVPRFDASGAFAGYRGVTADITAQVQAEEKARIADRRLHSAIDGLDETVVLTDSEDRVVFANRRALALNVQAVSLLAAGTPYTEFLRAVAEGGGVPGAEGRGEAWLAARLAQRASPGTPFEQERHDGYWQMVRDLRLPDGGMMTIGLDITARRRAEESLRLLNNELEQRVAERTTELTRTVGELRLFTSAVAHDVRAPLRGVHASVEFALEELAAGDLDAVRRHLARATTATDTMGTMVEGLLSLARNSHAPLQRQAVDLSALARDVCAERDPGSSASAEIVIADTPPADADPLLMRVVLQNLFGNALKYSAGREHPCIAFGATMQDAQPAWYVRDNGAGFDARYASKLFQLFGRLHSPREFTGSGIGLATVRRIIERHGGRIWAESSPGAGATFYFALRRERNEQ